MMPLGVPDIQRLKKGLVRGTGGDCYKYSSVKSMADDNKTGWIIQMHNPGFNSLCEDWLCNKILPEDIREDIRFVKRKNPCPCGLLSPRVLTARVRRMIKTKHVLD